jgi:hypothetical protein
VAVAVCQKLTVVDALLNISINLHGEPIMCDPDDTLHGFENGEFDILLLKDTIVRRRCRRYGSIALDRDGICLPNGLNDGPSVERLVTAVHS